MKKIIALLLALVMVFALVACGNGGKKDEPKTVAFVGFGPGDFFDMLANTYIETMKAAGWNAEYTSGNFDPPTQIAACENYIAMGVDVLVVWSVAPEAMAGVIDQAMSKGIKVIAFVAPTEKYDVVMVSEDAAMADYCAKLAAKWVDETYANAANGSLDVAVFTCRAAETGVVQGDVLLKMADYSSKIGTVTEIECEDETRHRSDQDGKPVHHQPRDQAVPVCSQRSGSGHQQLLHRHQLPRHRLLRHGHFLHQW